MSEEIFDNNDKKNEFLEFLGDKIYWSRDKLVEPISPEIHKYITFQHYKFNGKPNPF